MQKRHRLLSSSPRRNCLGRLLIPPSGPFAVGPVAACTGNCVRYNMSEDCKDSTDRFCPFCPGRRGVHFVPWASPGLPSAGLWEPPGSGGAAETAASPSPREAGAAAVLPRATPLSRAGPPRLASPSSPEVLECVNSPSVLRLLSRQAQHWNCPESSSPSIWCAQAGQRPLPHSAQTAIWRVPFLRQHSHRRLRRRCLRRRRSPLSVVRLLWR